MTRILFERSGGLLGQEINLELDLDTLPASESLNLMRLIQRSDFFRLPENLVVALTPDEFQYFITIETGSVQHRIRTTDTGAPESLRPLLNELSTLAMVS